MGDLLDSYSSGRHTEMAFLGYLGGDDRLAEGFAEAAEATLERWASSSRYADNLLLPMIYNYRHALELILKHAIRQAAALLRLNGDTDPQLPPAALAEHLKFKKGHRLEPLGKTLTEYLGRLQLETLPPDTAKLIARLHQLDVTGEAFRYSGHLNTAAKHVNVIDLMTQFREAFGILHGGLLSVLQEYSDYQREMLSELHQEYAEELENHW